MSLLERPGREGRVCVEKGGGTPSLIVQADTPSLSARIWFPGPKASRTQWPCVSKRFTPTGCSRGFDGFKGKYFLGCVEIVNRGEREMRSEIIHGAAFSHLPALPRAGIHNGLIINIASQTWVALVFSLGCVILASSLVSFHINRRTGVILIFVQHPYPNTASDVLPRPSGYSVTSLLPPQICFLLPCQCNPHLHVGG